MSERASIRGGRGGRGGGDRGGHRGARGGAQTHRDGTGTSSSAGGGGGGGEQRKKENILDLAKYMHKDLTVKFNGGREVIGTLRGHDQLMNLVLDNAKEIMRDEQGNMSTRTLGLLVARGTLLVLVSPVDGSEEIANPFIQDDE